jgi:hypothetical protein
LHGSGERLHPAMSKMWTDNGKERVVPCPGFEMRWERLGMLPPLVEAAGGRRDR